MTSLLSSGRSPVALRDARSRDPDLADAIVGAGVTGGGVDDRDHVTPAARPLLTSRVEGREATAAATSPSSEDSDVGREHDGQAARRVRPRRAAWPRPGRSRAGTPRGRKPAGAKARGEAVERLGADRLGAVECDPPAAQVELRALLGRRLLDAEVVGEVGPAADGRAGA